MLTSNEIVEQLSLLSVKDMIGLIATLEKSIQQRQDGPEGQMAIGCFLINLATSILEKSGCDIEISVHRHEWEKAIEYSTGVKI